MNQELKIKLMRIISPMNPLAMKLEKITELETVYPASTNCERER
jgi:hypothetical protein